MWASAGAVTLNLLDCPSRVLDHHGIRVGKRCDEDRHVVDRSYVAEGDRTVARQTPPFCPFHWRFLELLAKRVVVQRQNSCRHGPRIAAHHIAWQERILTNLLGESDVPGTNLLTDVAAVEESADRVALP